MSVPKETIRDYQRDHLMISEDTGDGDQPIAVLLFTPDIKSFDHHHIELDPVQCQKLHAWLGRFLDTLQPRP